MAPILDKIYSILNRYGIMTDAIHIAVQQNLEACILVKFFFSNLNFRTFCLLMSTYALPFLCLVCIYIYFFFS